jgi:small conductance mechanosensitive channel
MNAILVVSCGLWLAQAPAQQQKHTPKQPALPAASAKGDHTLTVAEKIARLSQGIEKDQQRLTELKNRLEDPRGEYSQADTEFKALNARQIDARKQIQTLKDAGKLGEAAELEKQGESLHREWQAARDRFDLAIEERKVLQEEMTVLRQKVERSQQYLTRLQEPAPEKVAGVPASEKKGPSGGSPPQPAPTSPLAAAAGPPPSPQKAGTPGATGPADTTGATGPQKPPSKHLAQALEEARAREAEAEQAREKLANITERLEVIRKSITLVQKLQETAGKRAEQAQVEQAALEKEEVKRQAEGAGQEELTRLAQKRAEAEQRLTRARAEQTASADRLGGLQEELASVQAREAVVRPDVEHKQAAAQRAQARVAQLENPFSFPNLVQWVLDHGPKVLLILVCMLALNRLVRLSERRIMRFMVAHGHRNTADENESRAQTLVGVLRNSATLAILGGGALMLLDEVGVPIMPLLGGAAVVGLAVAFGAQNLIRDYFSGFMVLLEDQYGINDVVKIGGVSGTVEKITLRMTVLRDMSGVVHFIPHGTITTVSNLTHGWSQALFDIPVSAAEDVDRVMAVLLDLGRSLRKDPAFAPVVLEGPEMLGVDDLGDGKVMLRFFIKTRPLKQWLVKREMLRRIKHRFDELGVGSPFSPRPVQRKEAGIEHAAA